MSDGGLQGKLFCFGLGYSARAFGLVMLADGWTVSGTCRDIESRCELEDLGFEVHLLAPDGDAPGPAAFDGVTHLLSSVPPGDAGEPVLDRLAPTLEGLSSLQWIGYLSTTGVYGDTGGARVDESSPLHPTSRRSRRRVEAENAWRAFAERCGSPFHIFRLAGIYGPGRNTLDTVRAGRARRIDKPGHRFSRIHVEDIVQVLKASIAQPNPGAVYNLCDDEPASPAEVTAFACDLLGVDAPPVVSFEEARGTMSAMALSFWNDNRTVDNTRIKEELGVKLKYPTYREGLRAALVAENE